MRVYLDNCTKRRDVDDKLLNGTPQEVGHKTTVGLKVFNLSAR